MVALTDVLSPTKLSSLAMKDPRGESGAAAFVLFPLWAELAVTRHLSSRTELHNNDSFH